MFKIIFATNNLLVKASVPNSAVSYQIHLFSSPGLPNRQSSHESQSSLQHFRINYAQIGFIYFYQLLNSHTAFPQKLSNV